MPLCSASAPIFISAASFCAIGGLDSVVDYGNKLNAVRNAWERNTLKSAPIAVGGIAALLAGACCVGPLVLVSLGIGGAWVAHFPVLGPVSTVFHSNALGVL